MTGIRTAQAHLLLVSIALLAPSCGGSDAPAPETSAPRSEAETTGPTGPTSLTVTPEEREEADLVLVTGETRENLELGGFALEDEEIVSPGPTITLTAGETTTLVLENVHGYVDDESIAHNFAIVGEKDESASPLWGALTENLDPGEADLITFTPDAPGKYFYICSLVGHMSAHGMWGRLIVE